MCPGNESRRPSLRSDSPRVRIRTVVRVCVRVRIFGSGLCALISMDVLNRGARPKVIVPTTWSFDPSNITFDIPFFLFARLVHTE